MRAIDQKIPRNINGNTVDRTTEGQIRQNREIDLTSRIRMARFEIFQMERWTTTLHSLKKTHMTVRLIGAPQNREQRQADMTVRPISPPQNFMHTYIGLRQSRALQVSKMTDILQIQGTPVTHIPCGDPKELHTIRIRKANVSRFCLRGAQATNLTQSCCGGTKELKTIRIRKANVSRFCLRGAQATNLTQSCCDGINKKADNPSNRTCKLPVQTTMEADPTHNLRAGACNKLLRWTQRVCSIRLEADALPIFYCTGCNEFLDMDMLFCHPFLHLNWNS